MTGSGTAVLFSGLSVSAGKLELPFSGLDAAAKPLPAGETFIVAKLVTDGGILHAEAALRVLKPAQAVCFAVLAREEVYREGGEGLLADYQLTGPGRLLVSLYGAGEEANPLKTWSIARKDALPHRFPLELVPGRTTRSAWRVQDGFSRRAGSPKSPSSCPFTLLDGRPGAPAVGAPAGRLPAGGAGGRKDPWPPSQRPHGGQISERWSTRRFTACRTLPVLGFVHGQTAGLQVLRTDAGGFAEVRAARHGDGAWVTGFVPQGKLKAVAPDPRYGVVIDKGSQTMRVYGRGRLLGTLAVSTGVYVPPGDDSFESIAGAFLTEDRIMGYDSEGFRYEAPIRIDGGNLIHQLGYKRRDGRQDYGEQRAQLGMKASHGCVRVDDRATTEGLSAWWLYANLPRGTKVLVLPEEGLPQGPDGPAAVPPEAEEAPPEPIGPRIVPLEPGADQEVLDAGSSQVRIVMSFGGDCVLGSEEHSRALPESFHAAADRLGFGWFFSGLGDLFRRNYMVRLENDVRSDAGEPAHRMPGTGPALRGHPGQRRDRTGQPANNHFPDYGRTGE